MSLLSSTTGLIKRLHDAARNKKADTVIILRIDFLNITIQVQGDEL